MIIGCCIPQSQDGGESASAGLQDGVVDQHGGGRLLTVDVPVEAGRGEAVEGGTVGVEDVAGVVERLGAGDHGAVVRQV